MDLTSEIADLAGPQLGRIGVYARNLTTGAVVDIAADRVLPTESAAKVFLLITYCEQVSAGICDPDRTVVLPPDFALAGTGVLRYLRPGIELSLEDLAWLMVIVSDNVATALLLLEIGGPDRVNETTARLGLDTARLRSFDEMAAGKGFGVSSPRHLAEAYVHLDERAREKLARQQDVSGLSRGVDHTPFSADFDTPLPVRVFNKTGTGIGTFVDAGLFETTDSRWVVAAMVTDQDGFTNSPDDPGPVLVGRIALHLHRAWA